MTHVLNVYQMIYIDICWSAGSYQLYTGKAVIQCLSGNKCAHYEAVFDDLTAQLTSNLNTINYITN